MKKRSIALIGIFWVYKNTVLGRAIPVDEGEDRINGVVDSPDNHNEFLGQ